MWSNLARARSWAIAWFTGMALIHAVLLWNARELIRPGYPDFTTFYSAGQSIRAGTAAQIYEPGLTAAPAESADPFRGASASLPFLHPPYEGLVFAPLSLLPYGAAYAVWNGINLLLLLLAGILLRKELPGNGVSSVLLWFLAGLGFFPVSIALLQGQDSVLLLLLFVLVYLCLKRRADFQAGIWLGLGLVRPQIVLPLLAVLMFRRRRVPLAGGFLVSAGVLGIVSMWVTNWRTLLRYPLFVLEMNRMLAGQSVFPADMPNLRGLALQWRELGTPGWLVTCATVMLAVLLIVLAGRLLRRYANAQNQHWDMAFAASLTVSLLVSFYLHLHDLSLLMLVGMVQVNAWAKRSDGAAVLSGVARFWRTAAAVVLAALFFSPFYVLLMRFRAINLLAYLLLFLAVALVMSCGDGVSGANSLHAGSGENRVLASNTPSIGK